MYNNLSSIVYIGLGSNLGDRLAQIFQALHLLDDSAHAAVSLVSQLIETEPMGGPPGQDAYLNGAAELRTDLLPEQTLTLLQEVENHLGRVRTQRWGPRTIDLDLLLFDDRVIDRPQLVVPHPRMHQRLFVMRPLAEIAPDVVHPVLGRTLGQIRRELEDRGLG